MATSHRGHDAAGVAGVNDTALGPLRFIGRVLSAVLFFMSFVSLWLAPAMGLLYLLALVMERRPEKSGGESREHER